MKNKPQLREALTDWWINSLRSDPFAYGAFDSTNFRKLTDDGAAWVVRIAMATSSSVLKAQKKNPTYVLSIANIQGLLTSAN